MHICAEETTQQRCQNSEENFLYGKGSVLCARPPKIDYSPAQAYENKWKQKLKLNTETNFRKIFRVVLYSPFSFFQIRKILRDAPLQFSIILLNDLWNEKGKLTARLLNILKHEFGVENSLTAREY